MDTMRVTLVQADIPSRIPQENTGRLNRRLASLGKTDLVILPEEFSTGFLPDGNFIQEESLMALEWMRMWAERKDAALAASIPWQEDGRKYNRLFFVTPDGSKAHYDKRHLFSLGHEDLSYSAGKQRTVVEFRGMRILLQVCYDLRFPVFMRNRDDYDMILLVASWPSSRKAAWDTLLRARALENQCFVAAVNRTGHDAMTEYAGSSQLLDARGRPILRLGGKEEAARTALIRPHELEAFRRKFPVLRDRDSFPEL